MKSQGGVILVTYTFLYSSLLVEQEFSYGEYGR